ncbi:TetR/AcrR family transcriptional regulator [Labrys sp. KB_33_2]|uniref:TetR/AcrR family transcriptional regulator n=1 Tax=Labrys sp. KB_33_2 TaxID=3237479 RepID=UPI003F93C456
MRKVDPKKYEAKRRHILDAAIACFSRKGFHQTSTAEICAEAGMSPGNLFHYFANKKAIIAAIVEEEGRQTKVHFDRIQRAQDLFAELLEFMGLILELGSNKTYLRLQLEIAAEALRDAEIGALVAANDQALQDSLRMLLRNAVARGQVDPTLAPADGARWIAALIDGIFNRFAVDPGFELHRQRDVLQLLLTRFLRPGVVT